MIDLMNIKILLTFLLTTLGLLAAPAPTVRLVKGGDFGKIQGLTGRGWMSSLGVIEPQISEIEPDVLDRSVPTNRTTRKLMYFYIDLVNVGRNGFDIGNAFDKPQRFSMRGGQPCIRGLWEASITDTNGGELRKHIGNWNPAWDAESALPNIKPIEKYSFFDPGLSPGFAARTFDPVMDGTLIDITDLPNGHYFLQITLAPDRRMYPELGQDPQIIRVEFTLNGTDARLWPPPVAANAPAMAPPLPEPAAAAATNAPAAVRPRNRPR